MVVLVLVGIGILAVFGGTIFGVLVMIFGKKRVTVQPARMPSVAEQAAIRTAAYERAAARRQG